MPDTDTLDPKDLFIACEVEFRSIVPLFLSWWSGARKFTEVWRPFSAGLSVIVEKAGDMHQNIDGEGKREKWIIAAFVYALHLITGRDDIFPVVDDEKAVGWLYRAVRGVVDMWRAHREAAAVAPAA